MRIESLLRKLVPASIVALVLAFSYFAPALGLVAPPVQSGFGVNCGRFGYGYHGGKHLFPCPNKLQPPPAVQPLGGVPPQAVSPPRVPAAPVTPPLSAARLPAHVAPPPVRHAVAPPTAPPQALGQVKQTGAFSHLPTDSPFLVALAPVLGAMVIVGGGFAVRRRRHLANQGPASVPPYRHRRLR